MSGGSDARLPGAAGASRPTLPNWAGFLLTIAIVWLGGQFVTQGVSDQFLDSRPELAVLWRGDSSDALGHLARARLETNDNQGAARLALKALRRAPLNTLALTTYGLAEVRLGRSQLGDRAMAVAGERGWRDLPAQIWLLRDALLSARFTGIFEHADALMRREDENPPLLYRILAVVARDPKAVGPLADRLATNPNWRAPFFAYLAADPDPTAPAVDQALLVRLSKGPAPPTDMEMGQFLSRLVANGKYADAESAWRQMSPAASAAARTYVYDGDFGKDPASTPFDWNLTNGVGWTATIEDAPGQAQGRALKMEYDGVSPPQPLRQLIMLPPGHYRLSGRAYDEGGAGAKLLSWRVVCADNSQVLATAPTPMGAAGQWREFAVELTAPSGSCPAQWLQLTADPGDEHADVSVWYDGLAITPVAIQGRPSGAGAKP